MCGLAGLVSSDPRGTSPDAARESVALMLSSLAHRGPDGEGIASFPEGALGHRRLAIIDLSQRGSQPMPLRCREASPPAGDPTWIVFNGEIYNYLELRSDLAGRGHTFASDSDTEAILHLYEDLGPDCVARLRGMFALALWDARQRRLMLARDRMGKKPLYYRQTRDGLAFASEIKALAALARARGEPVELESESIPRYLALKYIPGPETAIRGVRKLPPASLMLYSSGRLAIRSYWELPQATEETDIEAAGEKRLEEELRQAVAEAVSIRMRSDVPVGLFLSGGLDSGIVAATLARAARQSSGGGAATFTVRFGQSDYDEGSKASRAARAIGSEHHEIPISLSPGEAADLLPRLAWHLDQPFADSSALAVYLLAREVRRHVKVALTGDGGDELFLGYDRYRAHLLADALAGSAAGRAGLGRAVSMLGRLVARTAPGAAGRRNLPGRAGRFAASLQLPPLERNDAWAVCLEPEFVEQTLAADLHHADPLAPLHRAYASSTATDPLLAIQRADLLVYLPDDILHKVDAACMAHALEPRAPLLDHRVVELAMRIPRSLKLSRRRGKMILRKAFRGEVSREALTGRKAGFGLPLDHWLRTDLSGYCRDLLLDSRTLSRGILIRRGVEELLAQHQEGRANREEPLWALMMLEHWLRAALDQPAGARLDAGPTRVVSQSMAS